MRRKFLGGRSWFVYSCDCREFKAKPNHRDLVEAFLLLQSVVLSDPILQASPVSTEFQFVQFERFLTYIFLHANDIPQDLEIRNFQICHFCFWFLFMLFRLCVFFGFYLFFLWATTQRTRYIIKLGPSDDMSWNVVQDQMGILPLMPSNEGVEFHRRLSYQQQCHNLKVYHKV